MKGKGRRFVVDADMAFGAADLARLALEPRARSLAKCLNALWQAKHVAVFSPHLWREWKRHMGPNAKQWLARMGERRLIDHLTAEPDSAWVADMIDAHLPDEERPAATKDKHLVAAGCGAAEHRLVSGDAIARRRFQRLAAQEPRLRPLHWADASNASTVTWLLERAPDRPNFTLGYEM